MTTAPVLDTDALRHLGEQLGDADALCGFLRSFVGMLDQRIDRIERALSAQDHEGWRDAVLSLKTSSDLAGAQALATEAAMLQENAQAPPSESSATSVAIHCRSGALDVLRDLAEETAHQLRLVLQQLMNCAARSH